MWMPTDAGRMFSVVVALRRVSYSKADHIFWATTGTSHILPWSDKCSTSVLFNMIVINHMWLLST